MSRAHDLFLPDGLKLLLAITLLLPVFFIFVLINGFPYNDLIFPAVVAVVVSYAAACVVDDLVKSRTIKILIATVAAVISIILGYLLVRSLTMVCDPVHDPGGMICDPVHTPEPATVAITAATTAPTPEPTVIATTMPLPTPPVICDPVHQPNSCGQACEDVIGNAVATTTYVADKLEACLQNCNR